MLTYVQWRDLLRSERMPCALVDLDAFDRNARALAAYCAGGASLRAGGSRAPLRLATKSLRVPDLIRRALAHGPPYRGLMCFSAEEAAFLAGQGFDDLLVAYPTLQAGDLCALRAAHESGKCVRLVVDGVEGARRLDAAMSGVARPFPVVIDVDMSLRLPGGAHLGVRRSPVRSAEDLVSLLGVVGACRGLKAVGMMGYEAQVAGLGDRNPFKRLLNPAARVVRALSVRAVARRRERLAHAFERGTGAAPEIFNGGGTGSVNYAAREPWLTELSAGSALFSSHLFDYYSNVRFEPAAFFALPAVRSSDSGYVTCLGGGYVASGEPGWDRVPRPWLPVGARLVGAEACGEVQTPVLLPARADGVGVELGDPVVFRHAKAGELAERFNEVVLVSGGRVVGRAKTYRGLGQCFL